MGKEKQKKKEGGKPNEKGRRWQCQFSPTHVRTNEADVRIIYMHNKDKSSVAARACAHVLAGYVGLIISRRRIIRLRRISRLDISPAFRQIMV